MEAHSEFVSQPPRDLAGWVALFDLGDLPVLACTAEALEEMRANEDAVDARWLAETIADDPLLTLKLLSHVGRLRRGRDGGEVETVVESLVMLGIPPFFSAFGPQATIEDRLAAHPAALQGFGRVLLRARRAARFAIGFAVHRMDHDAAVIHEAALLHDFAELLLWVRAPALALQVAERLESDSTLRSAAVQREILHIELDELEHALMVAWRLPSLLVEMTDEHAAAVTARMRNVQLAIRVARHSSAGWDNAALPDDLRDIGALLNLGTDAVARLLLEIDAAAD
ncbi:MAG: HDOD domain-containing protein [Burkholderiales bacterium]|nr:HDOD domain-containing protein [Burkholderiales bacterium]MDE1926569.1 HDOD domain-containing protein [Burkholderiales bacterium]MDE2159083.1 HDOD domain-containing protein [Burkholderiales bacterium]MDE2503445.1 HDOD domain-containing protein [Burkholderiales bacterium]